MTICPNTNLLSYQELIATYGEGRALAAWQLNGQNIPTVEQAEKLLNKPLVSDIVPDNIYIVPKEITDFTERYNAIAVKKAELQAQGAIISKLGANGFHWKMPTGDNIYYQLTDKNEVKDDLQRILAGTVKTENGDLIQAALTYFRRGQRADKKSEGKVYNEPETFEEFIKRGLWYEPAIEVMDTAGGQESGNEAPWAPKKVAIEKNLPLFLDRGGENRVYHRTGDVNVLKINNGKHHANWEEYLSGLLVHNYFFPDTAYTLLGFIKNGQHIYAVVEQPFISDKNKKAVTIEEVGEYMSNLGFERLGDPPKSDTDYINRDLGIAIKDLHNKNVLEREGKLFFIDTDITIFNSFYDNKQFQLTTNKNLKNELQSEILEAIQGRLQTNPIHTTISNLARLEKSIRGSSDRGPSVDNYWEEVKAAGVDKKLTNVLKNFVTLMKGEIRQVDEIVVNGKIIPANAVTDILNKTIEVVESRADRSTLPEEVGHLFVEYLPEGSVLLQQMMEDIVNRPLYDEVMEQYSSNEYYQNKDGTVNEGKIAKEAIGKMLARVINEQWDSKGEETLWTKLWNRLWKWIQQKIGIYKEREKIAYEQVAEDILTGNVEKLQLDKVQQAMDRGEYYFELHPQQLSKVQKRLKKANELQNVIANDLYIEPHNRVVLEKENHIYRNLSIDNPKMYKSVTTVTAGEKDFGDPNPYDPNTAWGNDFDALLEAAVNGDNLESMNTVVWQEHGVEMSKKREWVMPEEVRKEALFYFRGLVSSLTADGSVLLTQVIAADEQSGIAGSIDLLAIDPYGNMKIIDLKTSWHSVHSPSYNKLWPVGEGSIFEGQKLSKKQLQALQLGTYSKLIYLKGYPVKELRTEHILLDRVERLDSEGNKVKDSEGRQMYDITGWRADNKGNTTGTAVYHESYTNTELHKLSENAPMIDLVVPTVYEGKDRLHELNELYQTGNPLHREAFNNSPEAQAARQEHSDELEKRGVEIADTLVDWRDYLKNMKRATTFEVATDSIRKIDELIAMIQAEAADTGDYSKIFTIFLTQVEKHLDGMKSLLNIKNVADENYISNALNAQEYINRFKDLIYLLDDVKATPAQQTLSARVSQKIHNTGIVIEKAIKETVKNLVLTQTSNPLYQDKAELEKAVSGIQRDISYSTKYLDSIGNSRIVILENLSKLLANKREEVRENTQNLSKRIDDAANELSVAMGTTDPRELFGWMVKNGKVIGTRGKEYEDLDKKTLEALLDMEGNLMKPYKKPITKEQTEFNKKLYYLKQDRLKFTRAEETEFDWDTNTVDANPGDYHRLSDKFQEEREEYMFQDPSKHGEWVPKDPKDKKWQEWAGKNMDWVHYIGFVTEWDKQLKKSIPTGETEERAGWFPLSHNIEVREQSSKKTGNISLWDKDYKRIMTGTSAIEQAQKKFYNTYIDILRKEVEKLPASAMYWFNQGNIPVITANFLKQLSNKDINTGSLIAKELRDFFRIGATNVSQDDESRRMSLPLFYMNSLQSQFKIDNLKKLIDEHGDRQLTATNQKDWLKEHRRLVKLLKEETDKPTAQQLDPDVASGLKMFVQMAENFNVMSGVEDTVLAVKEHLIGMTFKQGKNEVSGAQSRALELYNHMLETCFYNDPDFNDSVFQAVGNKLMKFTSAVSIPANLFGMANNKFLARINNRIEAFGDSLFSHIAYNRTIARYNTEHIPGWIKTQAEYVGHSKVPGKVYTERKAGSKYEALERKFNMVRHLKTGEGRVDLIAKWGGYKGYEAGEYEVQSLVGNAILDSINMLNPTTGETLSVYDAHSFNEQTGEVEMLPGFVYVDKSGNVIADQKKAQYDITNRIHETNDRIHGNYDPANKIMLERTLVGKMMLQFHKWVYPAIKSRYRTGKFDENLGGGMEIEGRYITLWNFGTDYIKLGSMKERWNELTDFQKANMKKDLADAVYLACMFGFIYLVKQAAKGIGDDDPYVKKMKNWLLYQSDRGFKEVAMFVPGVGLLESYQMVSQPFAAMGSVRSFGLLIHDMGAFPFRDEAHNIYQRGNYKGEYKVYIDMLRLAPGGTSYRRWLNLETIESFYIGGK